MIFPSVDVPDFSQNIKEDLNANPEDNPSHFIAVLVESLFVLKKVPEAAEVNYKITHHLNQIYTIVMILNTPTTTITFLKFIMQYS